MLKHVIAHGSRTNSMSSLKVDCGRKILYCVRESNLHQQCIISNAQPTKLQPCLRFISKQERVGNSDLFFYTCAAFVCVRLVKLKILEIRENHLKTLPKSFGRLAELERLDIGNNEFTDLVSIALFYLFFLCLSLFSSSSSFSLSLWCPSL